MDIVQLQIKAAPMILHSLAMAFLMTNYRNHLIFVIVIIIIEILVSLMLELMPFKSNNCIQIRPIMITMEFFLSLLYKKYLLMKLDTVLEQNMMMKRLNVTLLE